MSIDELSELSKEDLFRIFNRAKVPKLNHLQGKFNGTVLAFDDSTTNQVLGARYTKALKVWKGKKFTMINNELVGVNRIGWWSVFLMLLDSEPIRPIQ